ncbi:nose resistant to fluoxetine protein 6-like [Oppia nitens]|uniref:nose resistant to fluoxetine protein 6-like n=1 Tax=Oppia nitens TaxID=1686743 RepID=UPI0023DA689F|nr:nose resistant to fluoxetine protein 6-like [Oppia nitens]
MTALKLIDSSAVIGSGIIEGNLNFMGQYSECIGNSADIIIDKQLHKFNSQYCTLNIDFFNNQSLHPLIGICFPQSCNSNDLQTIFQSSLNSTNKWIQSLVAFSLYTNTRQLVTVGNQSINTINCFHGLRVISLIIVITYHTIDAYTTNSSNSIEIIPMYSSIAMQFILNGMLWIDIFFLLSGFLCAYSVLREVKQTSVRKYAGNILWKIIHRYIRLTPSVLAIIGFSLLVEVMSSSPFWFIFVDNNKSCLKNWWKTILYLTNIQFNNNNEKCLGHTWYLSADMQMFIVSPIFIILLTCNDIRKQYLGIAINILAIIASWTISAHILAKNESTSTADFRFFIKDVKIIDYLFASYCRIPAYCIGILMAYIYNKFGKLNINWTTNILLWILCIVINLVNILSTYFWFSGYSYHNFGFLLYGTISHTVWSICWAYMLYACAIGQGGIVNRVLSWSALIPLSRLSYQGYLIQSVLIFIILASLPLPSYSNSINLVIIC